MPNEENFVTGGSLGMLMIGGTIAAAIFLLVMLVRLQRHGTFHWFRTRIRRMSRGRRGGRGLNLLGEGDTRASNTRKEQGHVPQTLTVRDQPEGDTLPSPNKRRHKHSMLSTPQLHASAKQGKGNSQPLKTCPTKNGEKYEKKKESQPTVAWSRSGSTKGRKNQTGEGSAGEVVKGDREKGEMLPGRKQQLALSASARDILVHRKDTLICLDKVIRQISTEAEMATARILKTQTCAQDESATGGKETKTTVVVGASVSPQRNHMPVHSRTSLMRLKLSENMKASVKEQQIADAAVSAQKMRPPEHSAKLPLKHRSPEVITTRLMTSQSLTPTVKSPPKMQYPKDVISICPKTNLLLEQSAIHMTGNKLPDSSAASPKRCHQAGKETSSRISSARHRPSSKFCFEQSSELRSAPSDRCTVTYLNKSKTAMKSEAMEKDDIPWEQTSGDLSPNGKVVSFNRSRHVRSSPAILKQGQSSKQDTPRGKCLLKQRQGDDVAVAKRSLPKQAEQHNLRAKSEGHEHKISLFKEKTKHSSNTKFPKITASVASESGHLGTFSQSRRQSSINSNVGHSDKKDQHKKQSPQVVEAIPATLVVRKQSHGDISHRRTSSSLLLRSSAKEIKSKDTKEEKSALPVIGRAREGLHRSRAGLLDHHSSGRQRLKEPSTKSAGDLRGVLKNKTMQVFDPSISGDPRFQRFQRSCGHVPEMLMSSYVSAVKCLTVADTASSSECSFNLGLHSATSSLLSVCASQTDSISKKPPASLNPDQGPISNTKPVSPTDKQIRKLPVKSTSSPTSCHVSEKSQATPIVQEINISSNSPKDQNFVHDKHPRKTVASLMARKTLPRGSCHSASSLPLLKIRTEPHHHLSQTAHCTTIDTVKSDGEHGSAGQEHKELGESQTAHVPSVISDKEQEMTGMLESQVRRQCEITSLEILPTQKKCAAFKKVINMNPKEDFRTMNLNTSPPGDCSFVQEDVGSKKLSESVTTQRCTAGMNLSGGSDGESRSNLKTACNTTKPLALAALYSYQSVSDEVKQHIRSHEREKKPSIAQRGIAPLSDTKSGRLHQTDKINTIYDGSIEELPLAKHAPGLQPIHFQETSLPERNENHIMYEREIPDVIQTALPLLPTSNETSASQSSLQAHALESSLQAHALESSLQAHALESSLQAHALENSLKRNALGSALKTDVLESTLITCTLENTPGAYALETNLKTNALESSLITSTLESDPKATVLENNFKRNASESSFSIPGAYALETSLKTNALESSLITSTLENNPKTTVLENNFERNASESSLKTSAAENNAIGNAFEGCLKTTDLESNLMASTLETDPKSNALESILITSALEKNQEANVLETTLKASDLESSLIADTQEHDPISNALEIGLKTNDPENSLTTSVLENVPKTCALEISLTANASDINCKPSVLDSDAMNSLRGNMPLKVNNHSRTLDGGVARKVSNQPPLNFPPLSSSLDETKVLTMKSKDRRLHSHLNSEWANPFYNPKGAKQTGSLHRKFQAQHSTQENTLLTVYAKGEHAESKPSISKYANHDDKSIVSKQQHLQQQQQEQQHHHLYHKYHQTTQQEQQQQQQPCFQDKLTDAELVTSCGSGLQEKKQLRDLQRTAIHEDSWVVAQLSGTAYKDHVPNSEVKASNSPSKHCDLLQFLKEENIRMAPEGSTEISRVPMKTV